MLEGVYRLTRTFPKEELFVLASQIRLAAISVCSNIAEGASRISKREKKRFYEISGSSLVEIDTQLEISLLLTCHNKSQVKELEQDLGSTFKMLSKMITNLNDSPGVPTGRTPLAEPTQSTPLTI